MLKVGDLIKHLSENNPQASPARLTFLNFLNHLTDSEDLITTELLENFFATCLEYAHWQQNRAQLGEEISDLLEEHMDLAGLKWPEETQILEIDQLSDLTDALQLYLNSVYKKGEKYRLIIEPDKKILAVVLNADQSLTVRSFDKKMMIRHGQLEPLKKDFALHYTPDLELDPAQVQKLEIAPFVMAQFIPGQDELRGALVRGYLCQKFFELRGENIAAYPKLFYAVKRLEKHFINRQTDPFYQQTVSALEKTIENVRLGDQDAIQESMDILAQAQNALDYVFDGDKLLGLLIRDLQHTLSLRRGHSRPENRSETGRGHRLVNRIEEARSELRREPVRESFIEREDLIEIDERDLTQESRVVRTPQKVEESWNQKQNPPLFQRRERKSDLTN